MIRWRSQSTASICWTCQWRIANHRRPRLDYHDAQRIDASTKLPRRALHATCARTQIELQSPSQTPTQTPSTTFDPSLIGSGLNRLTVREHLQRWQAEFGGSDEAALSAFGTYPTDGNITNGISKQGSSSENADQPQGAREEEDDNEDYGDTVTLGLFLKPGDVAELHQSNHEPMLGVAVRTYQNHCHFYSANGRQRFVPINSIKVVLPAYVDPALLEPIMPFYPNDPTPDQLVAKDPVQVPPELGAPILAILDRLQSDTDLIYRTNASVLDTAYSTLAYPQRARTMTLQQIAKALLSNGKPNWDPSPSALLAVCKALNHNEFRIRPDRTYHRVTNVYTIRSKSDVSSMETVLEWVREYKEHHAQLLHPESKDRLQPTEGVQHIEEFIHKARRIITVSREYRAPSMGTVGPNKTKSQASEMSSELDFTWGEEFNDADKHIINFLQAWVLTQQFHKSPSLHSACTTLLNSLGEYQGKKLGLAAAGDDQEMALDPTTGHLFLQEIGVLAPHENRALYDEQLMLPMAGMSHNVEVLKAKSELALRDPNFIDTMSDLRHDWSSMIVWCVDDVNAREIDDGVSVERVPGREAEYWVHVHVANPTAFFNKSHVLSGLAAHMAGSVYTPGFSFPMLPKWLSQDYFSLEPNRPSLTFSTRIDLAGNILETKVQNGIVRNVLKISYSELSEYLDEMHLFEPKPNTLQFAVGEKPSVKSPRPLPARSEEELANLRDLYVVAKASFSARRRNGAKHMAFYADTVHLSENAQFSSLSWLPPSIDKARFVHGDPTVEVMAGQPGFTWIEEVDSTKIIEEMMLLTCRSAASWCAERGIPVVFRGTIDMPSVEDSVAAEQRAQQLLTSQLKDLGYFSKAAVNREGTRPGRAITHYTPIPHKAIGAQAYTKVTSPLRRFSDMVGHWQIEAAIRYEAYTGRKMDPTFASGTAQSSLPFSQAQLKQSMLTLIPRERQIQKLSSISHNLWVLNAFMRAFYYGEAQLPETFRVWITGTMDRLIRGHFEGFHFRTIIEPHDPGMEIKEGDQWECRIKHINMFSWTVHVEPIRLLYREPVFN